MLKSSITRIITISILFYQKLASTLSLTNRSPLLPKSFPKGLIKYSQVPKEGEYFTSTSIPKGLLKSHTTKKGTWGVIRVSNGKLQYQVNEPEACVQVLDECTPGIIEPQVKHEVFPLSDDLKFCVEFYRFPNTGAVDEKREGL